MTEIEISEADQNIIITSMEIALMVLSGSLGNDVRERALEVLDISDVEADVLEDNLEMIMVENEAEYV
tara:strand:- start:555 stop:758 length:204 start_codon:yes stop_codon:yes gene_type:complete